MTEEERQQRLEVVAVLIAGNQATLEALYDRRCHLRWDAARAVRYAAAATAIDRRCTALEATLAALVGEQHALLPH